LNRKLLTKQERLRGLGFKFNVNALLRGDSKTRGEFYFKGIRSGWFTPNEVRAYEELPPLPGGDVLYMSKDLSPIDDRGGGGRKIDEDEKVLGI
jgi:phage portal protein BeeE